jgi:hypothetical protein
VFNVCICLQHVLGELNFGIFLMVPMSHHNAAPPIFTSSNSLSSRDLVGASGFEPEASCAQGRRSTRNNPPVFSVTAETKRLSRDRSMWLAVRNCAHLSAGWAQKLAQSRRCAAPRLATATSAQFSTYPPLKVIESLPISTLELSLLRDTTLSDGARRPDDGLATKHLRLEAPGEAVGRIQCSLKCDISSLVQEGNLTPIVAAATHVLAYLFRIGIQDRETMLCNDDPSANSLRDQ